MKLSLMLAQLVRIIISWISILIVSISKPQILLYSVDIVNGKYKCDGRIEEIYGFLKKDDISFFEIIHICAGWGFIINFLKRFRPIFYLESIDTLYKLRHPLTKIDKHNFRVTILYKILKWLRPKQVWSIDDYREHQLSLLIAGQKHLIPQYMFQHGRFNKHNNIPDSIIPTKYVVWNEYWRDKLLALSSKFNVNQNNIIIGGKPSQTKQESINEPTKDDIVNVLFPYEPVADSKIINQYITACANCPNVKVIMKLRNDMSINAQIKEAGIDNLIEQKLLKITTNIDDILPSVDIVLGSYSTMLYELAGLGKAIGVLSMPHTQADDLVEDGIAKYVEIENICNTITQLANIPRQTLHEHAKRFNIDRDIKETLKDIYYESTRNYSS